MTYNLPKAEYQPLKQESDNEEERSWCHWMMWRSTSYALYLQCRLPWAGNDKQVNSSLFREFMTTWVSESHIHWSLKGQDIVRTKESWFGCKSASFISSSFSCSITSYFITGCCKRLLDTKATWAPETGAGLLGYIAVAPGRTVTSADLLPDCMGFVSTLDVPKQEAARYQCNNTILLTLLCPST